jgi:hypothetical protein
MTISVSPEMTSFFFLSGIIVIKVLPSSSSSMITVPKSSSSIMMRVRSPLPSVSKSIMVPSSAVTTIRSSAMSVPGKRRAVTRTAVRKMFFISGASSIQARLGVDAQLNRSYRRR